MRKQKKKKNENEQTRLFCQIFVIDGISIEGARAPWLSVRGPGAPWFLTTPMILGQESLSTFTKKNI